MLQTKSDYIMKEKLQPLFAKSNEHVTQTFVLDDMEELNPVIDELLSNNTKISEEFSLVTDYDTKKYVFTIKKCVGEIEEERKEEKKKKKKS